MGLFSAIKNIVSAPIKAAQNYVTANVKTETKEKVVNVANTALAILTKPVQSIINLPKAVEKTSTQKAPTLVAQGALNVLAVTAPFTAVGKTAAVSVGKVALDVAKANPIKTAVIGTLATGAIIAQPKETLSAIAKTPGAVANVGGNLANIAVNPSIENLKKLVTENPVIVGGAVAVGAVLGAKAILPAISSARTINAMEEQTEAIKESTKGILNAPVTSKTTGKEVVATNQETPRTAETSRLVTTKTTTARRKRKKKQNTPENYNKINIHIDNERFNKEKCFLKSHGRNR